MSILDDIDIEPGKGEDAGGSPPREEVEGLRRALAAERNQKSTLKSQLADLTAKVDELSKKPEKEYSRAELQSFVDDGRMSQGEADRLLDEQIKRTVKTEVRDEIKADLSRETLAARINTEIDKYTEVYPDILSDGSDNRRLVAEEYQRQLSLGKPDNMQTELDALAAVFGPSTRLSKGRQKDPETHQDVGSDGGGTPAKTGAPKLPANVKAHYEKMISAGRYKGWDDPVLKAEVETYKRPGW